MARLLLVIALLLWPLAALAAPAPAKLRVAVMPFETPKDQPAYAQYGVGTMDSLIAGLKNVPDLIMIDRARIELAIKEQVLGQTGLADAATVARLGKLLGAQVLISGSIQTAEGQIRIVANFVDAETGEIKKNEMVTGASIFELQDRLSAAFTQSFNVAVTEEQQARVAQVIRSTSSVEAYDFYLKGRQAYLQFTPAGYEQAIRWYGKAIQTDPGYALAYAGLAEAWNFWGYHRQRLGEIAQSDYQQAYGAARKAIDLNPNLAEAHRALGRASGYLNRGGRAESVATALKLNPNDAETLYESWFATNNQANPDHEYIIKALELNPDLAAARLDRGVALYNRRRYQEALAQFERAVRINPSSGEGQSERGNALFALKRYPEAIDAYHAALQLDATDAVTHSNLARALYTLKRYEEAIAESKEALRLNPISTAARNNLGLSFHGLKQYEQAINEYREALRVNPTSAEAHFNMAEAMRALNWRGDAINSYRAALGLNVELAQARRALADTLFDDGRFEEAVVEYQETMRGGQEPDEVHYRLGMALARLGKRQQAIEVLQGYLKRAPDAPHSAEVQEQIRKLQP